MVEAVAIEVERISEGRDSQLSFFPRAAPTGEVKGATVAT
jgi:hypothetical protein